MLTIQNIQKLRGVVLSPKKDVRWVIVWIDEIADGGYSYRITCKKVMGNQNKTNRVEFVLIRKETHKGEWRLHNNVKTYHHLVMNRESLKDMDTFLKYISTALYHL